MAFNSNTLAKARQLCSPEGERMMDTMKGKGGTSAAYFDNDNISYINESQMRDRNPNYNPNMGRQRSLSDLNIPDIVKESFANQSIDVSSLADPATKNIRAFDDIVEAFTRETEPTRQPIREETVYTPSQLSYNTNGGIDYNIIRQIVEECIDRKLKNLNESTLKSIKLKEGKITLAANNGNVFSANLEYKGNLNEQKNKKNG
jgi:hypothetical protein